MQSTSADTLVFIAPFDLFVKSHERGRLLPVNTATTPDLFGVGICGCESSRQVLFTLESNPTVNRDASMPPHRTNSPSPDFSLLAQTWRSFTLKLPACLPCSTALSARAPPISIQRYRAEVEGKSRFLLLYGFRRLCLRVPCEVTLECKQHLSALSSHHGFPPQIELGLWPCSQSTNGFFKFTENISM